MCTWYSGLRGSDVITVPETDPLGGPGTYHAAVFTVEEGEVHFQARSLALALTLTLILLLTLILARYSRAPSTTRPSPSSPASRRTRRFRPARGTTVRLAPPAWPRTRRHPLWLLHLFAPMPPALTRRLALAAMIGGWLAQ